MAKIYDIEQKTLEWLRVRLGKVTASEIGNLLTPEFKPRTGETPQTYLCTKLAEVWRGEPLPYFQSSWEMDQGTILEDEVIPWYELEYDCDVRRAGFVDGEDGRCGCSPDGLIGDDGGIEIKCPQPVNHVKYLLGNTLPKDYVCQVQMSMFVTGRQWWKFVSYRRHFPALVLTIARDEKVMSAISNALTEFYARFDEGMAILKARQ